jgi:hypothetical protein
MFMHALFSSCVLRSQPIRKFIAVLSASCPHVNQAYLRVVTCTSGNDMSFGTSLFIRVTHCASLCLRTRDLALSH